MAIGPNTPWKMKLAEWASGTIAVVTLTIICYSSIADAKAQTKEVRSHHDTDQARTDTRLDASEKWQEEALIARKEMFTLLYQIHGSVQRIEGQLAK